MEIHIKSDNAQYLSVATICESGKEAFVDIENELYLIVPRSGVVKLSTRKLITISFSTDREYFHVKRYCSLEAVEI